MRPPKGLYEIEDEITVDAAVETVMAKIRDATSWPRWQSEIRSVSGPRKIEVGDEVTGEARFAGFDVEGVSLARKVDDTVFVEDVTVGVRMQIFYEVSRSGSATVIRHRLEANLPGGPLGSVLSLLLKRRLRKMQKRLLRRLGAQASEGSA